MDCTSVRCIFCSLQFNAAVFCASLGVVLFAANSAQAGPLALGGSIDVSPIGAAVYTLPLDVPPGVAGVEPKLALVYNSQAGNGLLGIGWRIEGLSAITRCARTLAQDGVRGGVHFDADDRYCLDGERLIAIKGADGADATEYRTERDSFNRVVSYGSVAGGPAWFRLWSKAGSIVDYGRSADSRIEGEGRSGVRAWAMNRIADTSGNFLSVSYMKWASAYAPLRIDYTGHADGMPPMKSVSFEYEPRPDRVRDFLAGSLVMNTERLSAIETRVGAQRVTRYSLGYGFNAYANTSRLSSVQSAASPRSWGAPNADPARSPPAQEPAGTSSARNSRA
jgi:hypothetical protein